MMEEGINDELLHVATLCSRESPNLQDCVVAKKARGLHGTSPN